MCPNDKIVEKQRYNERSKVILDGGFDSLEVERVPLYLLPPIQSYRAFLSEEDSSCMVLELGAGTGEHTQHLLDLGMFVFATDISPASVALMKKKFGAYPNFFAQIADMECLPFADKSFDLVCSAGSLSYGENQLVMDSIYRVLKKRGSFVAMDSLNHNPVYKLNRFLHYLRGNRSKSTLIRMPTLRLIGNYRRKFGSLRDEYFGALDWLCPVLEIFFSERMTASISSAFVKFVGVKRASFKFTLKVTKK